MVKEVKASLPNTQIIFSSLIGRYDMKDGKKMADYINNRLRNYYHQQNIIYIDNNNITEDFIGRKKLHPTLKSSSLLAKNILKSLS